MTSKKVFITTDGFVAFIDRAHPKHLHASACFRFFAQKNYHLFTTPLTINEVYNELTQNISPSIAKDFLRAIELSNMNFLYHEESDIKKGLRAVTTSSSTELTLSLALTAIMCNKRSIPQVCTFSYFPPLFGLQVFYLPL